MSEDSESPGSNGHEVALAIAPGVKRRERRRRTRPRATTISIKNISAKHKRPSSEEIENDLLYIRGSDRPQTRADCEGGGNIERPCPWVGCKYHLYLDINPETGSIKINFPDLEPWELQHSCALDVAERGGITLEEIGLITNLTRERVRQVEVRGLIKLKMRSPDAKGSNDFNPSLEAPPTERASRKGRRRRRIPDSGGDA